MFDLAHRDHSGGSGQMVSRSRDPQVLEALIVTDTESLVAMATCPDLEQELSGWLGVSLSLFLSLSLSLSLSPGLGSQCRGQRLACDLRHFQRRNGPVQDSGESAERPNDSNFVPFLFPALCSVPRSVFCSNACFEPWESAIPHPTMTHTTHTLLDTV